MAKPIVIIVALFVIEIHFGEVKIMSGPIVRTGTTPQFWENYDKIFGDSAKKGTKKKAAAKKGTAKKKAAKKTAAKKSGKKTPTKKAPAKKMTAKKKSKKSKK